MTNSFALNHDKSLQIYFCVKRQKMISLKDVESSVTSVRAVLWRIHMYSYISFLCWFRFLDNILKILNYTHAELTNSSVSNLFGPQGQKPCLRTCAPSEDSDQPAHSRSLIRIFTERILDSQGYTVSSCGQRWLWSNCADAQTDLSVRWPHMSEGMKRTLPGETVLFIPGLVLNTNLGIEYQAYDFIPNLIWMSVWSWLGIRNLDYRFCQTITITLLYFTLLLRNKSNTKLHTSNSKPTLYARFWRPFLFVKTKLGFECRTLNSRHQAKLTHV